MSKAELKKLFEAYEVLLKSISYEFQEVIVSQPVDLKQYIYSNEKMLEETQDQERRALLKGYIDYSKAVETTRSVMQRQRYVFFDEKIRNGTKEAYEEAMFDIREKKDHVVQGLRELDLMVDSLNNVEILRLFHIFFNYEDALNVPIQNDIIPEIILGGNEK